MSGDWSGRIIFLALAVASGALWWMADDLAARAGLGDFPIVARTVALFAFLSAAERMLARLLPH